MPLVNENIVPWPAVKPYDKQAVPVPGTKRPGQTVHYRNGIWGLIDENTPNSLAILDQIFDIGMKAGKNHQVLGYRAVVSTNPLKYSPTFTWYTYGDIDLRRRYIGSANLIKPIPAYPDLVASICYTSGTTNNPKGVVLKHKNLALATQSNMYGLELPEDAILLSYLPLAHIYERICELCTIAVGERIGYFTGDPLRLLEDAQILKPNLFPSVPRALNKVYQAAMAGGNVPGIKGKLFNAAIQTKLEILNTTGEVTHAFWDRLVFRKIQAVLGGQIQLVISGSAPISPEVMDFLKIAFACEIAEDQSTGLFMLLC